MIYFTSDWHFNHDKDFIWKKRGYNSVEEMNNDLINKICSTLDEGDELWVLGDLVMGDIDKAAAVLSRIPYSVHFLVGNHDTLRRVNLYDSLGWVNHERAIQVTDGSWDFYLSHYPTVTMNYDDVKKHHPLINLHGHTHYQNKFYNDNPYMYNVGVDSQNGYPVSIDKIKADIKEKLNEQE
jgi:calcineurin-like phosphoesterase family protein